MVKKDDSVKDIFMNHAYLPWYHRPIILTELPLLYYLRVFTLYNVFMTTVTTVFAMIVVQIQEAAGIDPMGGDGFAFLFTALALLIALYIPPKIETIGNVRHNVYIIQQIISGAKKHSPNDTAKHIATRNQVISVIRELSQIQTAVPVINFHDMLKTTSSSTSFVGLDLDSEQKLAIETALNDILSRRPAYISMYMEALMHLLNFVMMTGFYPILLRERMDRSWAWIPPTAVLCTLAYAMTALLYVFDHELRAYGVLPLKY